VQPVHEEDAERVLVRLLTILEGGRPQGAPGLWRRRLTHWLTTRGTAEIPADGWPLLDEIWRRESLAKPVQRAADLARWTSNGRWTDCLSLWRGDITRVETDAIVNAANSGLTGCYVPFHACVDNAIHTASGPWLRQACEAAMALRGRLEPVGTATVTEAFYLPARHVIHTVGPVVRGRTASRDDCDMLAGCYRSCLTAAAASSIRSIAFCAISTGVFGFPKLAAAPVGLRAIREFVEASGSPPHVILVAFTENDETLYRSALDEATA
jgi:O-acetyl-ADP-ribose deacetylase (regulator of RNase III)